jgi:hypothetical protein
MGQNQLSEPMNRSEIGLFLLNAWKTLSWEFLLINVDHVRLAALMWKHLYTAGSAGGLNLRKWGLVQDDGLLGMARALEYPATHGCMHGIRMEMLPNEARIFIDKCDVVPQPPPDFCGIWCMPIMNGFCEGFDPSFGVEISSSVARGDDICTWRIVRKGTESQINVVSAEPASIPLIKRSAMDRYPFTMGYKTEAWIVTTRALLDPAGSPELIGRLISEMEELGEKKAHSLVNLCNERNSTSSDRVGDVMAICALALGQKADTIETTSREVSMEINECPLSSAPNEVCAEVEAFWKGVCKGCDPSLEFSYDRMMTNGEKTCHWTIRKKGEAAKEKVKEEAPDDPIKMLTTMYIKGEITEEELEKKIAHLRKLGLVR